MMLRGALKEEPAHARRVVDEAAEVAVIALGKVRDDQQREIDPAHRAPAAMVGDALAPRGRVTLENASSFSRVTAVIVNADVSQSGYSQQLGDWVWHTKRVLNLTRFGARSKATAESPEMSAKKPPETSDPLAPFSPDVRGWFEASFEAPTPAQAAGWPAIASGLPQPSPKLAPSGTAFASAAE